MPSAAALKARWKTELLVALMHNCSEAQSPQWSGLSPDPSGNAKHSDSKVLLSMHQHEHTLGFAYFLASGGAKD